MTNVHRELTPLTAVGALDGRYRKAIESLSEYFSEFALMRARLRVECEYLIALSEEGSIMRALSSQEKDTVRSIISNFSLADAERIKTIEEETRHDVKAIEYFLKEKISATSLRDVSERIHFALTSEDVNSIAHTVLLSSAREEVVRKALREIITTLEKEAIAHAAMPMLSRTHGQSATPTTFGKELRVFAERLKRQEARIHNTTLLVKCGGATGNWAAHAAAFPEVAWPTFAARFVERFNLTLNPYTTQIEPHDSWCELFDALRHTNTILIGCSQDLWRYISDGWLVQRTVAGEVGSSAMPHKVNPIDFENAEGNFGVANALFAHYAHKLPVSRLQRDLSDSTVERTFGNAFAHTLLGYRSLLRGLSKVAVNEEAMREALRAHPEVLAEAIQTVLRSEGAEAPYELLKELTRGKKIRLEDMHAFIETLSLSSEAKDRLLTLSPETYVGLSEKIARGEISR
jgi:adenylosuccinate lyase